MRVILLHIESGDYLEDPAKLQKDLHVIFGVGAENIEKVVVKELFRRLNLSLEEREDFDFGRSVQQARELFVARIKGWNQGG